MSVGNHRPEVDSSSVAAVSPQFKNAADMEQLGGAGSLLSVLDPREVLENLLDFLNLHLSALSSWNPCNALRPSLVSFRSLRKQSRVQKVQSMLGFCRSTRRIS